MAEPFEPARYVPLAAAALGLPPAPDDCNDVSGAVAILAMVAGPVMSRRRR
jgi:hypothetical protein